MIRWLIPFATLAFAFTVYYYPNEEGASLAELRPTRYESMTYAARGVTPPKGLLPESRIVKAAVVSEAADTRPELDAAEADRRWQRIDRLVKCAADEACELPQTDSRSAQFAVRDGLLAEARYFIEHRPKNAAEAQRSYRAARHLLAFPDEAVQEASLEWILGLPAQAGTIKALKQNVSDMIDPDLVRLSFAELKRHLGTNQEDAALDFAGEVLLNGGIFASRQAAELIPSLVTERNEARVRAWLAELPPESTKAKVLREGLGARRGAL